MVSSRMNSKSQLAMLLPVLLSLLCVGSAHVTGASTAGRKNMLFFIAECALALDIFF